MKSLSSRLLQSLLIFVLVFTSLVVTPSSVSAKKKPRAPINRTAAILSQLGGVPCSDYSYFTCVTIPMPLDHFNLGDERTIGVTFAILPAPVPRKIRKQRRKGMFIVATGGPGSSGVLSADSYVAAYDPNLFNYFDIVFFDQRGMGRSGGLACPVAAAGYYQKDATGKNDQEKALKQFASTFSADCVNELNHPELLPYLGTEQAAEDLEYFRQIFGEGKIWLYGESYGTQYAQTYAAKHGDRLAGLILDGTVDLTLTGWEYYAGQARAFNDTLVATLSACNDDPACNQDMGGNALQVYDRLAKYLSYQPLYLRFPLPGGGFEFRKFTLTDLELVVSSQMYSEGDRMMFNRALAAYASRWDLAPLARLLYLYLSLDPQSLEVIPDPSYSDAVFYGVECQDYGYPGETPDEKAENYIRAFDSVSVPRLDSIFYGDLPCAYWPAATSNLTRPEPLLASGIPTLVLGATADPATPINNAINVYRRLADGYLITKQGGPHVIFGYGYECPDAIVTRYLISGAVPAQRETVCDGVVADAYVPLAPRSATSFATPMDAFASIETEINYLPEFYYWDGFTPTNAGCTFGGTINFVPTDVGYQYTFNNCAFSQHFAMSGTGSYDYYEDFFVLNVNTEGYWKCNSASYVRYWEDTSLSGTCEQQPIKKQGKWKWYLLWKLWRLHHELMDKKPDHDR